MTEYLVPSSDAEAEFIERRSRFIGHIFRVRLTGTPRTMSMPISSREGQPAFRMTESRAERRECRFCRYCSGKKSTM